jgi:hypothetical protein
VIPARPSSSVCTTSPPIAAAVELAGVLLVELELGDGRADVGRRAVLELGTVCTTSPPIAARGRARQRAPDRA